MEITKSAEDTRDVDHEDNQQHGTATVLRLLQPWLDSNRHVHADSFFASVRTAEALWEHGTRFTEPTKTATVEFPKSELGEIKLCSRGKFLFLMSSVAGSCDLMAVL